ncbi:hypothetical protein ACTZWW_11160 [Salinarimonas sp. NSM]|uniref:hypothetical protein n=1 Tax=Salinarimonas sp. NSM TaxID=3458003 RepID=UPI00403584A7
MPMLVNIRRIAAMAALGLSGVTLAPAARADAPVTTPRACGGEAWSYAIVLPRSAPDGRYAVGPQTFCAEVAREDPYPLGPIGIVIDPFSDRAEPDPRPVPPLRRPRF